MRKSLRKYETACSNASPSSLSSSDSEFDLLNLNITYTLPDSCKESKKNKKVDSDSSSYDASKAATFPENFAVHTVLSDESASSVDGRRSSSLQSFPFSELIESPTKDSAAKSFINEISHHTTGSKPESDLELKGTRSKVTFSDKRESVDEPPAHKHESVTSSSCTARQERARRSPRHHSKISKSYSKQATSTAEKAIQVRSDRDRLGEGSLSDTDRSVVEIYRGCSETAVSPPRSTKSDSIGSTRPRIWGKKPLSPRLAHEPCTSSTNRRKPKYRMAHQQTSPRLYDVQQELGKMAIEGSTAAGENRTSNVTRRNSDEARRVFPFQSTPSGNLKIVPNQVVFESKKVSVLVADPKHTKVNVKAEIGNPTVTETQKPLSVQTLNQGHPEGSFPLQQQSEEEFYPNEMGDDCMEEIEVADESEQNLTELGFTSSEPIDWSNVSLPNKSDLYKLLRYRINNYINPDCVVHVGNEEFNCHHLILQCYSSYFDKAYFKEAELPESNVSPRAFSLIYDWMISEGLESYQLLRRDNILEVFLAAQFLGVKELEEQCWAFIECDELFSEETAFFLYLDAKKYGHTAIMEMMIPRIMKFFLTLVSSKDFLDLSAEELCEFLRSNYICVHSEIEVFMSAVRWLMHDWKRRQKHLIEVMTCIRFGLCAPWQLIDIQRNPENPEFVELMSNADVQKLVEEGVAFSIIKYWCDDENYHHFINLHGLTEPAPRNWIGENKNYSTYREFLRDLDGYRRCRMHEKKHTKMNRKRPLQSLESHALPTMKNCPPESNEILDRPLSMLASSLVALIPTSVCQTKNSVDHGVESTSKPTVAEFFNNKKCMDKYTSSDYLSRGGSLATAEQYEEVVTDLRSNDGAVASTELETQVREVLQAQEERELTMTQLNNVDGDDDDDREFSEVQASFASSNDSTADMPHPELPPHASEKSLPLSTMPDTVDTSIMSQDPICVYTIKTKDRLFQENCCSYAMSTNKQGQSNKNYLAEGSLFCPDSGTVLVFGGIDPHSQYGVALNTGKHIYRYQAETNSWDIVGELPEPRHHHSAAYLKGRVYLVGGADPRDDDVRGKSIVVSTVWSFDPVSRAWFSETGMSTPRKNFGLVVSNDMLYAIGGQDRQGRVLSSVERFDPVSSLWEEVASLEVGRMGVAAAKFKDLIWVAGGMTASKKSPLCRDVECYDAKRNVWINYQSLRFPRCFGRLSVLRETLYLLGGAGRISESERTTNSVGDIDVWDAESRQWCLKTEMKTPRHGHSVAILGTQILIIGGVTTVQMCALNKVECFCCERQIWLRGVCNLPTSLSGHASITLPPVSLL
ncbi:uncharacterized protein [Periplaneta americana]|uniref:uncharacterized protein isoform X2 n=1 Tax=Periplaneta americana TaxID=6978 RepID=UPI0037E777C9